ncbi:RNA polymerase Ispecific transcription initiation factor rrn3 [Phytophthora megakarya]|uniref:Splicing factor 3B subunit 4 n=1 Tax=Phytophthora megakarya TaxID=4795 RepID=A0A225VUL6_9STRA|nr:RNA polymerase Ispecific transcription initiation factor rrn3 [Phytophthora megakarya]
MLQAGSVCNVHMPRDKVSGAHQNYGFVEFRAEECAEYAVKVLNMIQLFGKVIRVKKASNDKKNLDVGANLFLGNLDVEVDEKLLYDTFSAFGGIIETPKIMRDPDTKASRGFGFVSFDSFEAADLAIECMNGQYLCNRQVVVQYAFKKDSNNERHGSEAERLLAQRNPNKLKPHTMFAFTTANGQGPPPQFGGYMDMSMVPPPPPMAMNYAPSTMMGVPPPPPPPILFTSSFVTMAARKQEYLVEKVLLDGESLKPATRGGATLTQVEGTDAVYLIGGANREGTSFGDVHRFDLHERKWTSVQPSRGTLPPRSGHSAVAIGEKIYVFGGLNAAESKIYNDTYVFDTRTSSWTKTTPEDEAPLPLVYGGSSPEFGAFSDIYILHVPVYNETNKRQPLRWEKLCTGGEIPEARELHCAVLQSNNTICFAGGRNADGKVCTDMALLNFITWEWQLVPICEWNRCSLVAGVVEDELVSFGGWDGGRICGDCCRYSDDEESWLVVTKPDVPARFGHCGTVISTQVQKSEREGLLIFGGMNEENDLNDLVLITPSGKK